MNQTLLNPCSRRLRISALLALVFALLLAPTTLLAVETTSSIRGRVETQSGSPVANASITVEDMRTGITHSYQTNEVGNFLAARLPVGGPYKITVDNSQTVTVDSISLGDIYNLRITTGTAAMEEVVVYGQSDRLIDVAPGPTAGFTQFDIETSVAFNRDIVDIYGIDPRINIDNQADGFAVNCAGKHNRFNSVTLDGVGQNDRFGLNSNGYATATGMPFPIDAVSQVAVELAPFDVTYGGFSACNINSVTKSGSNEWDGNVFLEYTSDSLRGDSIGGNPGDFSSPPYNDWKRGFSVGGPLIEDKLFIFAAYEENERPRFLAMGFAGSGNGDERPWYSEADHLRITNLAQTVYDYDTGGLPGDGALEDEKYMVRLDWAINDQHRAALIYNFYDGFEDRASDNSSNEFEYANHFYVKGSELETIILRFQSQWTDEFSTEVFINRNEMNDSQITVGPKDFAEHRIQIGSNQVYLGADDSRQANALDYTSDFFKITGQYLWGEHVITFGYESEKLDIFNQFVQHSRGGEYFYSDQSGGNPASCAALTAQGRFDDPACGVSGIDKFELGRPNTIAYGSGGGTNDPADAAANFSNTLHSVYIQDERYFSDYDLSLVYGLRYDWFTSSDRPNFNQTFTAAQNGLRNDANIDGVDILMPRVGITWGATDDISVRAGFGLYSGGNPNVWISNAWSNDGLTNVQLTLNNTGNANSVLDGTIPITGSRPGYDPPQSLFDQVAAVTPANAVNRGLVLIDPDYEQPAEWKFALGATWDMPWFGIVADGDILYSRTTDSAIYQDVSQSIVGTTIIGQPIYDFTNGQDNLMLTNSGEDASSTALSIVLRKDFEFGLDVLFGYSWTDSEDISPMTSSVAVSNFENLATSDINFPTAGTSNYLVPHRFTLRASYGTELIGGLESRVTLMGYMAEGQPQTYVMGGPGSPLEGDGFFGRHPLYIPTGPTDPNVAFGPSFPTTAFFDWIAREGLSPGLLSRNHDHAKWTTRFDLRVDQELPTFIDGTSGRLFVKIYNVGNLLNDDWGKVNDAQFFSPRIATVSITPTGQYQYNSFSDNSLNNVITSRSLWEARIGLEFRF